MREESGKTSTPAEPVLLRTMTDEAPVGAACGTCALPWAAKRVGDLAGAIDMARWCCTPRPCGCGAPGRPHSTLCAECEKNLDRERLHADFATAQKVAIADYDGAFVLGAADEDYVATEDVIDAEPNVLDDGTRFVWGTKPEHAKVDLESECADSWLSDHHEDAIDHVDYPRLAEAQQLVNAALAQVITYWEDRTVAVLLPPKAQS